MSDDAMSDNVKDNEKEANDNRQPVMDVSRPPKPTFRPETGALASAAEGQSPSASQQIAVVDDSDEASQISASVEETQTDVVDAPPLESSESDADNDVTPSENSAIISIDSPVDEADSAASEPESPSDDTDSDAVTSTDSGEDAIENTDNKEAPQTATEDATTESTSTENAASEVSSEPDDVVTAPEAETADTTDARVDGDTPGATSDESTADEPSSSSDTDNSNVSSSQEPMPVSVAGEAPAATATQESNAGDYLYTGSQDTNSAQPENVNSTSDNTSEQPPTVTPLAPVHNHSKSKLPIILLLLSVMLIGVAVAAWYIFSHSSKKQTSAAATTVVNDIADLRVASLDGPIGNDYLVPTAPPANFAMQIDMQVYEGLVGYENQKIVPLLASSWTNPDSNTWVFKLKDNIKFQNGKTMTAQDVKSSLDTLLKDQDWSAYLQTISSVSADNPTQVTIKTASPDSLLLNRLVYGLVFSQNADKSYSGTGAYSIDTANSASADKTKLVAFDGYHGGRPKTRAIDFTVYKTPDDVVKAMQAGGVDIAYLSKNDSQAQTLAQNNFAAYSFSNTGAYGLTLNMLKKGSPLTNLQVRQALAYALDRQTYVTKSETPRTATNYMIPQSVVGYDESAKFPDYNLDAAKQTLAKAGYGSGVPLTLAYINGIQSDAPVIADILNQAGFKITAKSYPSPKEFVAALNAGNYDLFLARFDTDLGDGLDIFAGLLGSKTSAIPAYNNPDFDKMISDAEQAFQPSDHVQKVQAINRFVATNYLWMPLANSQSSIYYPKSTNYSVDSITAIGGAYYYKVGSVQTASTSNKN